MMKKPAYDSFPKEITSPGGQGMTTSLGSTQEANHGNPVLDMQDHEKINGASNTEVDNLLREEQRLRAAYLRPGISKSEADRILKKYNETTQKLHDLGGLKDTWRGLGR
jgi:hypothetical protein